MIYSLMGFTLILLVFISTILIKTGLWTKIIGKLREKKDENKKEKIEEKELTYDPFTLAMIERNLNRANNMNN